eukprot:scaffold1857_cov86-Skeletonema_menzelii.AAC.1
MAKSSKRRHNNTGSSAKKQLKRILAHANAQSNPLAALPSAFLTVNVAPCKNNGNADGDNDALSNKHGATIHYYKSPLPEPILKQCLELFERNMGEMYRKSEWGLNMEEKRKELLHEDARFLIIMLDENDVDDVRQSASPSNGIAESAVNMTDDANEITSNTAAMAIDKKTKNASKEEQNVIGFAHFRFEPDEDSPHNPLLPITYVYELQISITSHGLGQKLMTLIELLSLQLQMTK